MASEPHQAAADSVEGVTCVPKVRTIACLGGVSLERGVPAEEIREYIRDADNLVWMDVEDPGPQELSMLLEEFGFHPLALEDVARTQQRAKVDEYKGYLFVVMHGVKADADLAELRPVDVAMFIGRNYLVSVHRGRLPALEAASARWTRAGQMLGEGVGFLVYTVMDELIDAYFPIMGSIEEQMSEMEVELFTRFEAGEIQKLLHLKRALIALRRILYPLREVFHIFCGTIIPSSPPIRASICRMCTTTSCASWMRWTSNAKWWPVPRRPT